MLVRDQMRGEVPMTTPGASIREAACMMKDGDTDILMVDENDLIVGTITDRDIVVRAVAEGMGLETTVREVMDCGVHYCFDDEDLSIAARLLGELDRRRLPVLNRYKRLVGVLWLDDIPSMGMQGAATSPDDSAGIVAGTRAHYVWDASRRHPRGGPAHRRAPPQGSP